MKEVYSGSFHKDDPSFIWNDPSVHIWNDMNEPAEFDTIDKTFKKDAVHHQEIAHRSIHSIYGLQNSKVTYEALKATRHEEPFILTRSFYPGT